MPKIKARGSRLQIPNQPSQTNTTPDKLTEYWIATQKIISDDSKNLKELIPLGFKLSSLYLISPLENYTATLLDSSKVITNLDRSSFIEGLKGKLGDGFNNIFWEYKDYIVRLDSVSSFSVLQDAVILTFRNGYEESIEINFDLFKKSFLLVD